MWLALLAQHLGKQAIEQSLARAVFDKDLDVHPYLASR
jgi:hypothetical protein